MNLVETSDQVLLRESARKLLEAECNPALVRSLLTADSSGHDPDLWSTLAAGGWIGLSFPEEVGGQGGTLFDLGLFFREGGRVLLPTVFASTIFAATVIDALGTDRQRRHFLPPILSGDAVATVAYLEPGVLHEWRRLATSASPLPGGAWSISGTKSFVANAEVSDLVVLLARAEMGGPTACIRAFVVEREQLSRALVEPLRTFGADRQADVTFSRVAIGAEALLGPAIDECPSTMADDAETGFEQALDVMTALQSVEMAGGAERVVEITADYVSSRVQFDRPIGSFQAVQHHVADMGIQAEAGLLLSMQAVSLLAEGRPARREVSHGKAWMNRAYADITMHAHQVWGGMGYVRESDLHLYSARAKAAQVSFGTTDHHLLRAAREIGA